jgi:hypothetical protein
MMMLKTAPSIANAAHNPNHRIAIGIFEPSQYAQVRRAPQVRELQRHEPTALPSSPIRAFFLDGSRWLSKPGSEASRNSTSVPNLPFRRGGTVLVRPRKNSEIFTLRKCDIRPKQDDAFGSWRIALTIPVDNSPDGLLGLGRLRFDPALCVAEQPNQRTGTDHGQT